MTSHCLHWGRKGAWRKTIKNTSFKMRFLTSYIPIKISDKTPAKKFASFPSTLHLLRWFLHEVLTPLYIWCFLHEVVYRPIYVSALHMWVGSIFSECIKQLVFCCSLYILTVSTAWSIFYLRVDCHLCQAVVDRLVYVWSTEWWERLKQKINTQIISCW